MDDLVVQHEVLVTRQQHAATEIFRRRVGGRTFTRHNFGELPCPQIIEWARQYVHPDGVKLTVFIDTKIRAKISVLIISITNIFRASVAVGFAASIEIHDSTAPFSRAAPAVIGTLVDLLKVNREFVGCIDASSQDNPVSREFAAAQMGIRATIVMLLIHHVEWFTAVNRSLSVRIRRARSPHRVFGCQRGVALQTRAEIPKLSGWKSLLGVGSLWRMDAQGTFPRSDDAPLASLIDFQEIIERGFGFSVKRSRERVDEPIGHRGKLRRDETFPAVVLPQQEICPE